MEDTRQNREYHCRCKTGFSGNPLIQCNDINECTSNQLRCHVNAECINIPGTFKCHCRSGFIGDGLNCTKVPNCAMITSCGNKANCLISNLDYYCSCKIGYYSKSALPQTQLKSDTHCRIGSTYLGKLQLDGSYNPNLSDPNSTEYNALKKNVTVVLTNTLNSSSVTKNNFRRVEVTGFRTGSNLVDFYIMFKQNTVIDLDRLSNVIARSNVTNQGLSIGNATVADYDECTNPSVNICYRNQSCINLPGTYSCQCKQGYTGPNCIDINECAINQSCGINTICSNTNGSYNCTCMVGYLGNPYSRTGCSIACSDSYCRNDGKCYLQNNARRCNCVTGYTGTRCDALTNAPISQGAIIGIAVGCVALIAIIMFIAIVYYIRVPKRQVSFGRSINLTNSFGNKYIISENQRNQNFTMKQRSEDKKSTIHDIECTPL